MHLAECSTRWELVEYDEFVVQNAVTSVIASDEGGSPKQSCKAINDALITWIFVVF